MSVALLPGPAFIPWKLIGPFRDVEVVPPGYVWKPATDGTMAGWVRPHGDERCKG